MKTLPHLAALASFSAFVALATVVTIVTVATVAGVSAQEKIKRSTQDPAGATAPASPTPTPTPTPKKLAIRVLYAGNLPHPRTEQWKQFLGTYFTNVQAIKLSTLSKKATEGFDVVIVDSPSPYQPDRQFKMPEVPVLGPDYDRPTILMGAAGGALIRKANIKIRWL